jgi:GST-like protein
MDGKSLAGRARCKRLRYSSLEELRLPYRIHWVDLAKGEQRAEDFLALSPGAKIPALFDAECSVRLFESAAILIYLADKSGQLLAPSGEARYRTLSWLMWQVGSQGPMLGQAAHFVSHARNAGIEIPYAAERYVGEAKRCYDVMDRHLAANAPPLNEVRPLRPSETARR